MGVQQLDPWTGEEEKEEEDEEVEEEARAAVKMPDPRKPRQKEIDEHELTH